jgi:Clp amino terminal domain, pathogenicity island component
MFERFTNQSRRVVALAQEEARMLNHNYIGTGHLLLGLIRQGDNVAVKVLDKLGADLTRRNLWSLPPLPGRATSGISSPTRHCRPTRISRRICLARLFV